MTSTTINDRAASQIVTDGVSIPLRAVALFLKRRMARRELNDLTVEQLRDVGIDPDVISREHKLPADPWLTSRLQSLM
ncbi:MAG: DUF1127 domain-containing protein [Kiloniellaceae bacterium]|nr:DUF1127 domain-containing protein [Kiloniellaceae bacterium]